MGKQQACFRTACVFLFLSLASQINSVGHKQFLTTSDVSKKNQKENNLINKLPGQPSVNFKQYGGHIAVDKLATRYLYYYFVEANNANASTPLVLWFNGGPGCSSLKGAFMEHGPFRVHSDGKTLYRNPYSWNNEANVLYVEMPALVGFSYITIPKDEYLPKFLEQGDKLTAEDNYAFLVKWLERFPEYKGREFYISGQSYGGHYVPQLAQIITQRNNQTFINLKGIFIGNPGLDEIVEEKGNNDFLVAHALVSQENRIAYDRCRSLDLYERRSQECTDAEREIVRYETDIDPYNIYAPKCLNSTLTSKPKEHTTVLQFDPCSEEYMKAYLRNANVQEAMHGVANTTKLPYQWEKCANMNNGWNYEDTSASMLPILSELIGVGVRVMVYSGDLDAVISFTATKDVIKKFNQTIEKGWRPWFCEGEVGGYIEEYKNNFTFVTVRGAGHSVPSDQPIRALALFTSFIRNTTLPDSSEDSSSRPAGH